MPHDGSQPLILSDKSHEKLPVGWCDDVIASRVKTVKYCRRRQDFTAILGIGVFSRLGGTNKTSAGPALVYDSDCSEERGENQRYFTATLLLKIGISNYVRGLCAHAASAFNMA